MPGKWERWEDIEATRLERLEGNDVASCKRGVGGQVGSEELAR